MDTDEDERDKSDSKLEKTKDKTHKKTKKGKRPDYKWVVTIFITSFIITVVLSMLSNNILKNINIYAALVMLFSFILLGVVFDIIGLAIATADEKQFHSMAAQRINSAKCAIKLIRSAEKVSSFCNDVIGDIAGILSGATGAAVIASLYVGGKYGLAVNLAVTALIAAFTVGAKACGKSIAINNSNAIVNAVSKIIWFLKNIGRKRT